MLLASAACGSEYHPEYHPVSSYTVNQSVSYPTIYEVASAPVPVPSPPAVPTSAPTPRPTAVDASHVLVVESPHLDRAGEVIGVVDVQDSSGSRDSGLAQVRQRAAEMGADAVVGLEFHPTHVSGLAVRFLHRQ